MLRRGAAAARRVVLRPICSVLPTPAVGRVGPLRKLSRIGHEGVAGALPDVRSGEKCDSPRTDPVTVAPERPDCSGHSRRGYHAELSAPQLEYSSCAADNFVGRSADHDAGPTGAA